MLEAVAFRVNAAEGEALAVFFRRGAVGIEDVALIKDGLDDLVDEGPGSWDKGGGNVGCDGFRCRG